MRQVSLIKCLSYNESEVEEAVRKSIECLGGIKVKCYCCQELCPEKAVEIGRNWAFKLFK